MDDKKKDMSKEQVEVSISPVEPIPADEEEDEDSLILTLKKPYKFEGQEYTEIDLTGLENLTAQDMISVNKILSRSSTGIDVMPEVSLEYACILASKAAKQPIEFFTGLPPKVAIKVKNRVMGFLFGTD